jgi:transposase
MSATLDAPTSRRSTPRERALERRVAELEIENAALKAENAALKAVIADLQKRFSELEARLQENSTNSHRPPSSDPPGTQRARRKPSGRKQGAQPGHKGATRALLPVDEVDEIVTHFPTNCGGCRRVLKAKSEPGDPAPRRHQVWEAPRVEPTVTEHQACGKTCECGAVTYAELPPSVEGSCLGPRAQATVALLTGRFRLSRREAQEAMSVLFGIDLSLGSVTAVEQATSAALAEPYEEALAAIRAAEVANVDETGWFEKRHVRAWLWVAVTSALAVFWIDPRRSGAAFRRFLGNFAGYLITDRWKAYFRHPRKRHQICWGHLQRDFEKLVLRGGEAKRHGEALLAATERIFETWYQFKRGECDRASLRRRFVPIKAAFHDLLLDGLLNSSEKAQALCSELLSLWPCLWVFVEVEGVEPTNNAAERGVRPAVLWRKGSFGSQSEAGSTYVARMLTVVGTLRKQKRHILDFLVAAVVAYRSRAAPPSIVYQ